MLHDASGRQGWHRKEDAQLWAGRHQNCRAQEMMEFLRVISEFQALGFLLVTAVGTLGSLWFQWQNSRRLKGAAENIQKVETATNSLMEQARLAAHAAGIEVGRIAAEAAAMTASTLAADA